MFRIMGHRQIFIIILLYYNIMKATHIIINIEFFVFSIILYIVLRMWVLRFLFYSREVVRVRHITVDINTLS